MGGSIRIGGVLAVLLPLTSQVAAQEGEGGAVPLLCAATSCALVMDWRGGLPNVIDRRYGNPYQFEALLLSHLQEAGYSFVPRGRAAEDAVVLRVEPEMTRAMCDRTPGTNTDNSCQTIGEVRVEILNADADLDVRRSIRIRGRCEADQQMDVARMSQHVAASIDYELRGRKGPRPSTRC